MRFIDHPPQLFLAGGRQPDEGRHADEQDHEEDQDRDDEKTRLNRSAWATRANEIIPPDSMDRNMATRLRDSR
jgi:hypothetical protein